MSIRIIKAGMLDTIQDAGRFGYRSLGINPGGAMDGYAIRIANLLVGNNMEEAVLELHFPASVFLFQQPALIAISGANFSATVSGEPVPLNQPLLVARNSILQFHRIESGARVYLSVQGGLEIKPWLKSCSTNLKAAAGGFGGRALQKEDQLNFKKQIDYSHLIKDEELMILHWQADIKWEEKSTHKIKVLPGHEWDWLEKASQIIFPDKPFHIKNASDRMGYRLDGTQLKSTVATELVSSAVSFGTIQLLPDGQLIVLMADHQTTGGYPRIAHVITTHLSRMAQLRPGEKIQFELTDMQTAEDLLVKQQQHLLQLQNACTFRLSELLEI